MDSAIVLDRPDQIQAARLLALRGMLKLEVKGMKGKVSIYALIKREFGLKGNKRRVLEQFEEKLRKDGILR